MKVLILGATGSVGRHLVEQALWRGHEVTVLARDPKRVVPQDPRIRIVQGDALDPQAPERAVAGQDAVIYAIGADTHSPPNLFLESTRLLISAMEKYGVRRLVAITGIGAGDSRGHGGFLYDKILFPLFTKKLYRDKDRQEELIRNSKLDWGHRPPGGVHESAGSWSPTRGDRSQGRDPAAHSARRGRHVRAGPAHGQTLPPRDTPDRIRVSTRQLVQALRQSHRAPGHCEIRQMTTRRRDLDQPDRSQPGRGLRCRPSRAHGPPLPGLESATTVLHLG